MTHYKKSLFHFLLIVGIIFPHNASAMNEIQRTIKLLTKVCKNRAVALRDPFYANKNFIYKTPFHNTNLSVIRLEHPVISLLKMIYSQQENVLNTYPKSNRAAANSWIAKEVGSEMTELVRAHRATYENKIVAINDTEAFISNFPKLVNDNPGWLDWFMQSHSQLKKDINAPISLKGLRHRLCCETSYPYNEMDSYPGFELFLFDRCTEQSLLHLTAAYGCPRIVYRLLSHYGADPANTNHTYKYIPLMSAIPLARVGMKDNTATIAALSYKKSCPDARDIAGRTATDITLEKQYRTLDHLTDHQAFFPILDSIAAKLLPDETQGNNNPIGEALRLIYLEYGAGTGGLEQFITKKTALLKEIQA